MTLYGIEINIKVVLIGEGGVGKTSIISAYLEKDTPSLYVPTIGSNIARKEYNLAKSMIRIACWDIGGQRSFNPLNPAFFSNIDAALLVFDLSNSKETLLELQKTYLRNILEKSPDCSIFFIGNKSDLIKPEEMGTLMNILNQHHHKDYSLIFTSAKNRDNITEAFEAIIFNFLKKLEMNSIQLKGIAEEFLKKINKSENELKYLYVNVENIDPGTLHSKISPQIKKTIIKDNLDDSEVIPKRDYLQDVAIEQAIQMDRIRKNIMELFGSNLNLVNEYINELKRTPINSLLIKIQAIENDLLTLKNDFDLKLNAIMKLKPDIIKS
jgi:small GTP-binding protein